MKQKKHYSYKKKVHSILNIIIKTKVCKVHPHSFSPSRKQFSLFPFLVKLCLGWIGFFSKSRSVINELCLFCFVKGMRLLLLRLLSVKKESFCCSLIKACLGWTGGIGFLSSISSILRILFLLVAGFLLKFSFSMLGGFDFRGMGLITPVGIVGITCNESSKTLSLFRFRNA